MPTRATFGLPRVILVASLFAAMSGVAAAQVPLSEVELRLVRTPTGGCVEPC